MGGNNPPPGSSSGSDPNNSFDSVEEYYNNKSGGSGRSWKLEDFTIGKGEFEKKARSYTIQYNTTHFDR